MRLIVGRFREHLEQDEIIAAVDLLIQVFALNGLHDAPPFRSYASAWGAIRGEGSHAASSSGSRRRSGTSRPSSARAVLSPQNSSPPPLPALHGLQPRPSPRG